MAGAAWPLTRIPITKPSAQNGRELSKLITSNWAHCNALKSTPPKVLEINANSTKIMKEKTDFIHKYMSNIGWYMILYLLFHMSIVSFNNFLYNIGWTHRLSKAIG